MKLEIIEQKTESANPSVPILFIHGMWHGAWCWTDHFLPYFAQHGHPSYALSLRNHGTSEGKKHIRSVSLSDYVKDVEQAVNGMERMPVMIGHSMGGIVIQKYLESHQAPAAVLMASVPPQGLLGATLRFALRHPLAFLKIGLTLSVYPVIATSNLCREMLFSESINQSELKEYFSRMQDESLRAFIDMIFFIQPHPKLVKTPMLVLGAMNDGAITPKEVQSTARKYGTEAELFPDMAHNMMLEPGWKAVADRILGWLNEQNFVNSNLRS